MAKAKDGIDIDNLLGPTEGEERSPMEEALEEKDEWDLDAGEPQEFIKGDKIAKCVKIEEGEAGTGAKHFQFTFSEGDFGDKKLSSWVYQSAASRWKLNKVMAAFGIKRDPDTNKLKIQRSLIEGKWMVLKCSTRKWEGEDRQDIDIKRAATQAEIDQFTIAT